MPQMPYGYYDRTDSSKNYEKHLFVAGAGLQSAELNEVQDYAINRIQNVANALFKDGDIIRDASINIDQTTGGVVAASGAIYVRGAVRGVAPRSFTVATAGVVTVGIYLEESVVSALEDDALLDPATGTRNYQEPGASRLKVVPVWGWAGERSDADFFPVYEIENGVLRAREAPPAMDGMVQAIARYDRDSSGGTYVVSGMRCQRLPDSATGQQVYSVAEGRARVRGYGVEFAAASRLGVDALPDLRYIDSEPHLATTATAQIVTLDNYPVNNITQVRITAEKTVTMTHGAYAGIMDQLPDSSVLSIQSVKQGATTYVATTDYKLTSGKVDWSPTGAEPATGSTYTVTYRYITSVTPDNITNNSVTVSGAVVGSLIMTSYNQSLPRYDRIGVNADGKIIYVTGVSANWNPRVPDLSENVLGLATIYQTWDGNVSVTNDGVRVVPMNEIAALNTRIDFVLGLVAQQRLTGDINLREAGTKKGVFTDPLIDDSQRDSGIAQTGAVFDGILTLPISVSVTLCDNRGANGFTFLAPTDVVTLQQTARTTSMKINPYMAFDPIPATVRLEPSVDRWTDVQTVWTSSITQTIWRGWSWNWWWWWGWGWGNWTTTDVSNNLLSTQTIEQGNLRQIDVRFSVSGFGPGERLTALTFDGIDVTSTAV